MPSKTPTKTPTKPKKPKPVETAAPPPFEMISLTGSMTLVQLTSEIATVTITAAHSPRGYAVNLPVATLREWIQRIDQAAGMAATYVEDAE